MYEYKSRQEKVSMKPDMSCSFFIQAMSSTNLVYVFYFLLTIGKSWLLMRLWKGTTFLSVKSIDLWLLFTSHSLGHAHKVKWESKFFKQYFHNLDIKEYWRVYVNFKQEEISATYVNDADKRYWNIYAIMISGINWIISI